jgi:hypothetical protein
MSCDSLVWGFLPFLGCCWSCKRRGPSLRTRAGERLWLADCLRNMALAWFVSLLLAAIQGLLNWWQVWRHTAWINRALVYNTVLGQYVLEQLKKTQWLFLLCRPFSTIERHDHCTWGVFAPRYRQETRVHSTTTITSNTTLSTTIVELKCQR